MDNNNKKWSAADVMLALAVKYNGDWNKIYTAIKERQYFSDTEFDNARAILDNGVNFVSIISPDYPESLKKIYKPPFGLFYKGDIKLLSSNAVGLIGDRLYTNHIDVVNDVFTLASRSGTPLVLSSNNPDDMVNRVNTGNIMVLPDNLVGSNLNNFGLVVSERPLVADSTESAPWMMRVQTGLATNMLFTGTKKKGSPSLIGVGYALYLDKTLQILPSSKVTSTNTKLISDGSPVFTNPDNLFKFDAASNDTKSLDA